MLNIIIEENLTMENNMEKECCKCLKVLPLDMFGNSKKGKYGKKNNCKNCRNEENKDYRKTKNGIVTRIYEVQKRSSIKRNHLPPAYTKEELRKWLYSKVEFHKLYDIWVESGYDVLKSISVDRISNNKGYSFDNIQLVDWATNIRNYDNCHIDKKVAQYSKDMKLINIYKNGKEASCITGISASTISNCCNLKQKTSGGFKWKFIN